MLTLFQGVWGRLYHIIRRYTYGTIKEYRHTLFNCTSQILCFLQIGGLWQPCIKKVYWHHFSNSLCSLHVSVNLFGNSHNISNFCIIILLCNGDLGSMTFDVTIVII